MQKNRLEALVKTLLLNAISSLKDEEYQRRVWFKGEGPEVDSYIDSGVFFIDKCENIFKISTSKESLGEETYDLLKKLYNLLIKHIDRVEERIDPDLLTEDELLNDPKWHDIQTIADNLESKLLEFLQRSKNDEPKS